MVSEFDILHVDAAVESGLKFRYWPGTDSVRVCDELRDSWAALSPTPPILMSAMLLELVRRWSLAPLDEALLGYELDHAWLECCGGTPIRFELSGGYQERSAFEAVVGAACKFAENDLACGGSLINEFLKMLDGCGSGLVSGTADVQNCTGWEESSSRDWFDVRTLPPRSINLKGESPSVNESNGNLSISVPSRPAQSGERLYRSKVPRAFVARWFDRTNFGLLASCELTQDTDSGPYLGRLTTDVPLARLRGALLDVTYPWVLAVPERGESYSVAREQFYLWNQVRDREIKSWVLGAGSSRRCLSLAEMASAPLPLESERPSLMRRTEQGQRLFDLAKRVAMLHQQPMWRKTQLKMIYEKVLDPGVRDEIWYLIYGGQDEW